MKKTSRIAGCALAAIALAALPFCALTGCTEGEIEAGAVLDLIAGEVTAEELIQKSIAQEIQNVILEDETGIANAIANTSLSELSEYGIDSVELLQDYLSELNYDIGDIAVNGDTATVELTLNYNSIQALASEVGVDLAEVIANFDIDQLPIKEIKSLLSPIISAAISAVSDGASQSMLLDFELVDGKWQLTDQAKREIMSTLLQG
ncbi:MAG: hypothetical protein IKV48_07305 [Eggerthellaceae bacterium]|nr:hypothetical protein [Eggerthellaceae bacterium]